MSGSLLIDFITSRLLTSNYRQIATPFSVASVHFEFDAAFIGNPPRSSDLVIVVDTSVSDDIGKIGDRVRQKLQALSRALDITSSNLVLTVILTGASLPPVQVDTISRICRVLVVNSNPDLVPDDEKEKALEEFEDRIRSLLPLAAASLESEVADPITRTMLFLKDDVTKRLYQSLTSSNGTNERAVRTSFVNTLETELTKGLRNE